MEIDEGNKATEIGQIPEDWSLSTLNELVFNDRKIRYGIVQPGKFDPFGRFMVRGQDYSFGWVDETDLFKVSAVVEERYQNARLKTGDIILTIVGAGTGNVIVVPYWLDGANITQTTARISINPAKANPTFCMYSLEGSYGKMQVNRFVKGGAQPGLNICDVQTFKIAHPPTLKEQQAIAEVLTDTDNLIQALEKQIAKKRFIKQGVMQELLTPKEGWVKKKLGDSSDIYRGGSPRPIESYITTNPDGINWIKIGDVGKSAKFIESTEEKIIQDGMSRSRFVKEGDFLLSNSMSFGRPYILKTKGCIHDGWLVIQNYQNHFDREFLYYVLGSESILIQYKAMASGSSVLNLNKEIVKNVVVSCPESVHEQNRISTILSDIDNEISLLEIKLLKQASLKQGLMQNLLTGTIRLLKS